MQMHTQHFLYRGRQAGGYKSGLALGVNDITAVCSNGSRLLQISGVLQNKQEIFR